MIGGWLLPPSPKGVLRRVEAYALDGLGIGVESPQRGTSEDLPPSPKEVLRMMEVYALWVRDWSGKPTARRL